jgi:hypothetical protein
LQLSQIVDDFCPGLERLFTKLIKQSKGIREMCLPCYRSHVDTLFSILGTRLADLEKSAGGLTDVTIPPVLA